MATIALDTIDKVYPNGFHAIHELSLEAISGGPLRIGDRLVNDVELKDRDIAMVFQIYARPPHMSVADHIGSALKLATNPTAAPVPYEHLDPPRHREQGR